MRVGLVLGGGGSRGLAHIGVLKVLVRENIPIDFIVGTSMGAIIGTVFALGFAPETIEKNIIETQENSSGLDLKLLSARGRQKIIREQLARVMAGKTFADLQIPVTAMAVDMIHGKEVELKNGDLLQAMLASSAVPAVFPPVPYEGMQLADGGVIDSLATHVACKQKGESDCLIAVDVYPELEKENPWVDPITATTGIQLPFDKFSLLSDWAKIPSVMAAMWRSSRVITWYLHQYRLENNPPDVLMRPTVDRYGSLDFKNVKEPIQAGVNEAEKHLPALKARIGQL